MACYDEVCDCFKEDDCERIKNLIEEHTLSLILPIAAAYSSRCQRISANMARAIIQAILAEANMHHAIWSFDEIINGNKTPTADATIFQLVENEVYAHQELSETESKSNRQQLLQHIGLCSDPEFDQFLSLISETNLVLAMSDNVILVTLERVRRRLKDDRAFFLVLHSAYMTNALEVLVANVSASQAMVLDQLQEQGYEVEIIPGTTNAFIVHQPDGPDPANHFTAQGSADYSTTTNYSVSGYSQSDPCSGTAWAATHSRRRNGRRRR